MYLIYYFKSSFWLLLYSIDEKVADVYQFCPICNGKLNKANYPRKIRGLPNLSIDDEKLFAFRFSLCCKVDGCRKRITPPSVRFLGRRIYSAAFIVLVSALQKNKNIEVITKLSPTFSKITLRRWNFWWASIVSASSVWKTLQGSLTVNISNNPLPIFLLEEYNEKHKDENAAIIALLEFISSMTEPSKYPLDQINS